MVGFIFFVSLDFFNAFPPAESKKFAKTCLRSAFYRSIDDVRLLMLRA